MGADISLELDDNVKILNNTDHKEYVILVDDNTDQLTLYKFLLNIEIPSYNILTFSSAESVLEFLNHSSRISNLYSPISVIISDYNMFPKNGLDLFKEIKKSGLNIPFILFSSFISEKIRQEAEIVGISRCIDKNIDISKTIQTLTSMIPN